MAMPAFTLARRLQAGETVFTGWCGLPYPLVAETLAREGFPAVAIESQHGLWDVAGILAGVAAIRQGGAAPIVRVPLNDFALVSRALDFGAEGIIAPMINTPADARPSPRRPNFRRSASAAGARTAPWRSAASPTCRPICAKPTITSSRFAMIETRTALQNFEAIINTPGIDGFFLGPSDLSIALSDGKTVDPLSKEVDDHLDTMIAGAQKAKKIPGAYCHPAERAVALRQARRQIPHGVERSFDVARRRGGRDESPQELAGRAAAPAAALRRRSRPGSMRASVRSRQIQ